MQTLRARIIRLAAASAVVVSLGALSTGPAAAQTGIDIPSRPAAGGTLIPADDIGSPDVFSGRIGATA